MNKEKENRFYQLLLRLLHLYYVRNISFEDDEIKKLLNIQLELCQYFHYPF
jgi:hypothetical protein